MGGGTFLMAETLAPMGSTRRVFAVDEFFADKPESPEQGGLTMWYVRKR